MSKKVRKPPHPGEMLREELIPGLGISKNRLAADLGINHQTLHLLCKERCGVTAATALKLAAYFGGSPEVWMGMQSRYNLWRAEAAIGPELERIRKRGQTVRP